MATSALIPLIPFSFSYYGIDQQTILFGKLHRESNVLRIFVEFRLINKLLNIKGDYDLLT